MNQFILAILSLTFLAACQKNGQVDLVAPPAANGPVQGPSDGGGGDTCNGKMIESFKIDVTQLDEFKDIVLPILKKVSTDSADEKKGSPFLLTPKMKNWYLIDCKLQDIPKERKGLYLETDQTAIHTSREIFISSSLYEKMAKEEKAKLLLHEMIMSYYLMKYLSLEEICKLSNTCSGEYDKFNKWKMFKPETYRALNDGDHQRIRAVTAWMWSERDQLTPASFVQTLNNNDFDKRFNLVSDSGSGAQKEIEFDVQTFVRMFKKQQWSHSFPKFCQFENANNVSASSCQTEIIANSEDYEFQPGVKLKRLSLKVKITRESDRKEFIREFGYPLSTENLKIKLYLSKLGYVLNAAPFGVFANWPNSPGFELKEGSKSQMLFMLLNVSDLENPEVYQIMFQNYVWYSFEDQIVKKDGATYRETYGYANLIPDESENLFAENELPFVFPPFLKKNLIKSELIPN